MRSAAVVLAVGVATLATGCVAVTHPPTLSADTSPSAKGHEPGITSPTELAPAELEALYFEAEPLIGLLSSARGTDRLGPFPTRTGRVAVYIRCFGDGILEVEVDDSAAFTQQCLRDGDDPGTRNTLDVAGDSIRVTASAEDSNLWAIAVTEIPPR